MAEDISVLGIAVETRGVKEGSDALDRLTAAGGRAEKSTNTLGTESRKTSTEIVALAKAAAAAAGAFGVWSSIKGIASSMIEAQQAAQKLRNSLSYAADGAAGASKEIQYLREVTTRLGMDFATSSAAYAKFAAATKDSGVSLSQTKTVFEGIAAASAKLGLSADETQGALLALSQMASKGTVSAEELRGQLGERLPGAFNIAAKSMGVTTAELGKMLQAGEVMASDFLPRFGQALKDQFQAPLNSLTQELNRFSSAWTVWKTELSDGANGGGFKWLTNGLNESAAAMHALGAEAGITQKLLMAIGGFQAGAAGVGRYDTAQVQVEKIAELKKVKAEILAMQTAEENGEIRLSKTTRNRLDVLKEEEKTIRQSLLDLAVRRGKETGLNMPDIAGEFVAQEKKKAEVLKAYLSDTDNAPKAAKVAAAVEKENAAFKIAVAAYSETDQQYQSALKVHNERVAELQKQPKGANTARNDASQEYAARLSEEKDFTKTQIELIKARVEQRVITEEEGIKQVLESQTAGFAAQQATLSAQLAAATDKGDKLRIAAQLQAIANEAKTAQAVYETAMAKIVAARESAENSRIFDLATADYNNAASIEESTRAMRDQTAEIGLNENQLLALNMRRIDDQITMEEWRLSLAGGTEAVGAQADAIRDTIKALNDRKLAVADKSVATSAKKAAEEWKKTADKIGDSITDALMRGFESGKGFAETLRDTVVNMFSTMVLRPTIQATVMGGMSAIGLGSGSALANTSSATSSLGSIGSLASGANTAYDMFSSGASTTYTKLAESGIGQSLGLSTAQAPGYMAPVYDSTGALISEGTGTAAGGLTELGSSIGSGLTSMGAGLLGSAIGSAIAGDYRVINGISGSTVGAGAGAAVGSIVPVIGTAVGAAVGGILGGITDRAFGMQEKKQGETGIKGTFTGTQFAGSTYSKWTQKGGWFRSDDGGTDQSPLDSSISDALGASFTLMKLETGRLAEGLGVETAKIASYSKYISVAMTGDSEANAKALSDAMAGINNELAAVALSGTNFALANETSSETLNRLYNSLTTVNQAFEAINISAYNASLESGNMASQLALAMGGLDAFKTSVTEYYKAYFSAAEQQADLTAQVTSGLAAVGVAMPASKEAFRAVVEGLDLTTAASQATFAGMMKLAPSFAAVTDYAEAAAKKLADTRSALMQKYADPSTSSAVAVEMARAAIKKSGVIDIDGLDANGIRGELRQVIFGATQETMDAISGLSGAFDTVIKDLDDMATAAAAAATAERERVSALKASAQEIVDNAAASFKASESTSKASTFGLSAAEVTANQTLVDALNNATAGLDSLKNLGLDSKVLAQYTDQLKAIISEQTKILSVSVMKSRTLDGDVSGALASALSTVMPSITDAIDKNGKFVAANFNMAMEDAQSKAAVMVGAYAADNALSIANYQNFAGLGAVGSRSSDYIGIASARSVSESDYGTANLPSQYALRSIVAGAIAESARTSRRDETGLNAVYAARSDAGYLDTLPDRIKFATDAVGELSREFSASQLSAEQFATGVKMVSDTMSGADSGINSLSALDQAFNAGKISTAEYAASVKEVSASMAGAVFAMPSEDDYAAMQAAAAEAVKSAGYASLQFYFGKLDGLVGDLAEAAAAAATPLAQVNSAIGLLKSAATVFGQSAAAAAGSDAVAAGSDVGKAQTIADAAAKAAGLLTTQTSQAVQNTIALSSAFADMSDSQRRDASLMLDGIGAFDNTAFYNTFLKLSDALKKGGIDTAQYTELFGIALDTTTGNVATAADRLNDTYSALSASIDAEKTAINASYQAQADALKSAYDAAKKIRDDSIALASSKVSALETLMGKLASAASAAVIETDATLRAMRASSQEVLSSALSTAASGGSIIDFAGMDDAITNAAKPAEQLYSSFADYQRDQGVVAGMLADLGTAAASQKSVAAMTLDALNAASATAEAAYNAQLAALEASRDAQLANLDATLAAAKAQIDALNGINTSVMSLPAAMAAMVLAVTDAAKGGAVTASFSSAFSIPSLPSFAVGTNYVPGDMTAQIHEGERIVPAADNRALMDRLNTSNGNAELIAEVKALRESNELLRAEVRAVAGHTNKAARLIERAMPSGNAFATEALV